MYLSALVDRAWGSLRLITDLQTITSDNDSYYSLLRALTGGQTDGRYQVYYLPAFRSITKRNILG